MSMATLDQPTAVRTTVKVLFFGKVGDHLGRERDVAIPERGCTVGELRRLIDESALAVRGVRASVNRDVAPDDARVRPGDEVAFFSVFSGG